MLFKVFVVVDQYPEEMRPVQRPLSGAGAVPYVLGERGDIPARLTHYEVGDLIGQIQVRREPSLRLAIRYIVMPID